MSDEELPKPSAWRWLYAGGGRSPIYDGDGPDENLLRRAAARNVKVVYFYEGEAMSQLLICKNCKGTFYKAYLRTPKCPHCNHTGVMRQPYTEDGPAYTPDLVAPEPSPSYSAPSIESGGGGDFGGGGASSDFGGGSDAN